MWLLYGAYGYTGELVARQAAERGERPVLAGRDRAALTALGRALDLPTRVASLDDAAALAAALEGVDAVLHCAGPFVRTARPMVEACLARHCHYLDITGEIAVFERHLDPRRGRHDAARAAGIVLLSGVGFDVVPTDCLASTLAAALPDASHLELAFSTRGGSFSPGTLKTMLEAMPQAGAIRRDGRIVPVPLAYDSKDVPFPSGPRHAMTIPWGDVSTAYHSTGIPNLRVYSATPRRVVRRLRRLRPLLPLLGLRPVKRLAQAWVGRAVAGPDPRVRATARTEVWGEARNPRGATVAGTLVTPEAYHFTALSAVEAMRRVLAGGVEPGAWTPSRALGAAFVRELPGVEVGEVHRRD